MNTNHLDFFMENPIKEFIGSGFEKYRPHWHWDRNINNASLYYIANGSLSFELGSSSFLAEKGDIVFLRKSDHAKINNKSDVYSNLYYIAFNYDESCELNISTHYRETPYEHLFKEILDAHRSQAQYSGLKIHHTFHRLLYSLLIDSLHSKKDYILTSRINKAAEYININFYKNISIDHLCKITGYSPAHLRRLFTKTFGVPPQTYILDKRIEAAKEMLLDIPRKNVDEIADLLGMSSTSYFCKLFKAKTGCSPMLYRDRAETEK